MRKSYSVVAALIVLAGCVSQSHGPELRVAGLAVAPGAHPAYSQEQAHAICYAEAMNTGAGYSVKQPLKTLSATMGYPDVETRCVNTGDLISCRSSSGGGGGFWGGVAEGYANAARQRERARPQVDKGSIYYSCLAKIGYVKF